MKKEKKTLPSAGHKVIKKSGLQQVADHIKSLISEKCHNLGIVLDYSEELLVSVSAILDIHVKKNIAQAFILERYFFVSICPAAIPGTCLAVFLAAVLLLC